MPNVPSLLPRLTLAAALCGVALLSSAPAVTAARVTGLTFSNESKIWLEGDSTLHRYKSTARTWQLTAKPSATGGLADLEAVVPVRELKSGDAGLDKNLYAAIKADKFPTIRFSADTGDMDVATGGAAEARVAGTLTIAGVKKPVTLTAAGKLSDGTLRLKGSKALLMSDFGIQPPVLMLGAIKCTDAITVHYDLIARVKD
jgi:polyisoprenoid-binding protein YceI